MSLVVFGLVGLGILLVALVCFALYALGQRRKGFRHRLDEIGAEIGSVDQPAAVARTPLHERLLNRLDDLLEDTGSGQELERRLARAGVPLTPGQFVTLGVGAIVVGGALGGLLRQDLLTALIVAIVAAFILHLWLRRREKRRAQQFTAQLSDTMRVITGALRVGHSLAQAIETVSHLAPEPTRSEFEQVSREMVLGMSLPESMKRLAVRMDSDAVRMMVAAMSISSEVGGNLVSILDNTTQIIRDRNRLVRDVQVLNAQQIMTGNMLMVLPVIVGGILYLLNPDYMRQLFVLGPTLCIPGGAGMLMIIGYVLVRRILAIEV